MIFEVTRSKRVVLFMILSCLASIIYFFQLLRSIQIYRISTTQLEQFSKDSSPMNTTFNIFVSEEVTVTVSTTGEKTYSTSSPKVSKTTYTMRPSAIKKITWLNIPKWLDKLVWNDIKFSACEVNSCKIEPGTEKADIVIIFMVGYRQTASVYRPPGQIWVLFGQESPANSHSEMWLEPKWKDKINWTMTYRLDSSFPLPYGYTVHRPVSERPDLKQVMLKKKKLVAWVVSNCHYVRSGRAEYVELLNTHLPEPVDIYGACGTKTTREDLFQKIDEEYKFYLGFENSLCKDYISEKFHHRQNMNLVVIVRGSGNYSHFYPINTFIDTRDFKSTKQLADHILYLDKNNTAYLEYLQNKAPYKLGGEETLQKHLCEMCKRIHQPMEPSHYTDIGAWWYNDTCTKPKDLV